MLSANLGAEGGKERKLWKFGNQNFTNPFFFLEGKGWNCFLCPDFGSVDTNLYVC